ncbi:MAG TPA: HemK2/MTQ2 family protein methyltransferase [Candidatus Nanoarchaeia archaeon]|nr:HemK2/MTQ2 family protein methyltransferase [Candidatus Nanoarchaeia archaeon]
MPEIYTPEEDSYLLSKVLKENIPRLINKEKSLKILEIGSGSGIQIQTLLNLGIEKEKIFSADINHEAVIHCQKLGFNCIESNLFEKINDKYDIIIFNPPYLPEDKKEPKDSKLATTGGKEGSEIINEFLKQAKEHLNQNGKIFLLISSLTRQINWLDYNKKIIDTKKMFFEELYVLELTI